MIKVKKSCIVLRNVEKKITLEGKKKLKENVQNKMRKQLTLPESKNFFKKKFHF